MIKFLLKTLLFSITSFYSSAQNITLDQTISLRSKSIASLEEFLTSKTWTMVDATDATDDKRGTVTFAYQKNSYDDKAKSFLTMYYGSYENSDNRLSLQVNAVSVYNTFMTRLKLLGYKIYRSKIKDGAIIKTYKGRYYVIEIFTDTQKDDYSSTRTNYTFFITTLKDYKENFEVGE